MVIRNHKRLFRIFLPVLCLFLSGLWLSFEPQGINSAQAQPLLGVINENLFSSDT